MKKKVENINNKNPFDGYLEKLQLVKEKKINPIHEIVNTYYKFNEWENQPKEFYKGRYSYGKLAKEAKELLIACNNNFDDAMWAIDKMKYKANKGGFDWTISTCLKYRKLQ